MRGNTGFIHKASKFQPPEGKSILKSTAADLVREHGESLIGRRVWTQPIGGWPGGLALVTEVASDKNAPQIVFMVAGLEDLTYPDDEKTIGIFDYEICYLLADESE